MSAAPIRIPVLIALVLALSVALGLPGVGGAAGARGQSPSARISVVGGQAAEPGTFPWLVVVFHEGEGEAFQCTGTVVSPNVILTAAHCVEDPRTGHRYTASGYLIVTGTVDWTHAPRQVLGVSNTVVFPSFNRLDASGDAALLVLSTPTTAPAVPLASSATDAAFVAPGHHALMAGWGETSLGGPVPHELHWAGTTVQSSRYCEAHSRVYAPAEELCTLDAPTHHAVACFGDSGGPLLGTLPATGEVVELGIASHLYTACEPTSPVVYTRADLVRSWVQDWVSSAQYLPGTVTPASAGHTVAGVARTAEATPGLYSSVTASGEAVTLHVAGNGEWITGVTASATLSCAGGTALPVKLGWPTQALFISAGAADATLPIPPTGRLRGGTATLGATFTAQGTIQGQLSIRASGADRRPAGCTAQLSFTASP